MDYAASMNAVKAWRIQTSKYRESMTQNSSGNQVGLRRCWFCGLPGHCVVDCSETLDCELQKLGERAINSFDTWLRGEVLCLRCLGVGHWGAQCHLSVTEAASRAHDKAEFWRLNKRNNIESSREQGERQLELVTEGRGTCDYTNRDTAGVVCYNCNEMGHWARYCPRHRSSSTGGGQSSGSGKGHQSSTSSGSKLPASPNQGKWKAYAPIQSFEKSVQEETRARYSSLILQLFNRHQPIPVGAWMNSLHMYLTLFWAVLTPASIVPPSLPPYLLPCTSLCVCVSLRAYGHFQGFWIGTIEFCSLVCYQFAMHCVSCKVFSPFQHVNTS
jgi:hypothetical protein